MWEIFIKLCEEKGVTVYRVGEDTGIKSSTFSGWRRGLYTPKDDKLQKIADYFGVPLGYLKTGQDPEEEYYSPEAKEIMQDIHDREDLRALFHVAKKSSPEYVEFVRDFLQKLLEKESDR